MSMGHCCKYRHAFVQTKVQHTLYIMYIMYIYALVINLNSHWERLVDRDKRQANSPIFPCLRKRGKEKTKAVINPPATHVRESIKPTRIVLIGARTSNKDLTLVQTLSM